MADTDRQRWNQRYRDGPYDFSPAPWLVAHEALLRPERSGARALDIACGGGRNSLYLAGLGYSVDAWDISDVGLDLLRQELARRGASGQPLPVTPQQVDLDVAELPVSTYDLILDAFFLQRSVFPAMVGALRPDGLLVVRVFMRRDGPDDRNPDYLLDRGELRAAVSDLHVLDYQEHPFEGWAGLVGRRR
jgi:SAM-dependent methyltransferase